MHDSQGTGQQEQCNASVTVEVVMLLHVIVQQRLVFAAERRRHTLSAELPPCLLGYWPDHGPLVYATHTHTAQIINNVSQE
jgi:hypothetical protein